MERNVISGDIFISNLPSIDDMNLEYCFAVLKSISFVLAERVDSIIYTIEVIKENSAKAKVYAAEADKKHRFELEDCIDEIETNKIRLQNCITKDVQHGLTAAISFTEEQKSFMYDFIGHVCALSMYSIKDHI